jgi:hypothetical protein
MKLLTTITAVALVMAATGCETTEKSIATGYVQKPGGDWVKKGTPFFGDGTPLVMPPGVAPAFDGSVFTQAMAAQQQAPQPVIVVGPGDGTTIATQSSYGTVVTKFGGDGGIYKPPMIPINTGNQTPTVYTMPIQQP